jgi:RecJ-like exonuclease
MAESKITCPHCRGRGSFDAFVEREDGSGGYEEGIQCRTCRGAGVVSDTQKLWIDRGALCRLDRVKRGESLMQAADRLGLSPAIVSGMEQGKSDPAPLEAAAKEGV